MTATKIDGGRQIQSGTITTTQLASAAAITDAQLAVSYAKADGTRAFTGEVGGVTPTTAASLATKGYVDGVAQGLDTKASVRAATSAAGTLATSFANTSVIDGVTLATNDRILIKDQSSGAENGIYTVNAAGAPTRATDADVSAEVTPGMYVFVEEGTVNADSGWTMTNNGTVTLGSTALVFAQFSGAGQVTVDASLIKTGNQLKRAPLTGDVTAADGSNSTVIAPAAVTLAKQANLAANSVIGNLTGSGAVPAAVATTAAATASTVVARDANANVRFNNTIENFQTVASAAGTTTLAVGSPKVTQITGATTQIVKLPDATTLVVGQQFTVTNRSSGVVTLNDNSSTLVQTMAASSFVTVTCTGIGSAAGTWDAAYTSLSGAGTVTTASVVSANGFNGSVATATSTPVITLTTTVTGVLKGNGTAMSAATLGTDYVSPVSFVTRDTLAGTKNGSNVTFTLTNTPISGTESLFVNGVLQDAGGNDYSISTNTVTFVVAPVSTDKLLCSYLK